MPTLGTAETKVRPAGSRSVTCTPVALLGPLLVAVTVKVTLVFWFGVVLLTVLVMAMSAATGVMVALAELLPGTGSGWSSAVLVAVLVVGERRVDGGRDRQRRAGPVGEAPMFQIPVPEV